MQITGMESSRIAAETAATARTLARCHLLDDSIAFAEAIRDHCWRIQKENAAADLVVSLPPFILADLLLGWRDALSHLQREIRDAVSATGWDRKSTKVVRIRGTRRVWLTAQRLLQEVRSEQEISGSRETPLWYLELALAEASILSLREFFGRLPNLLDNFIADAIVQPSTVAKVTAGSMGLQALSKADMIIDELPKTLDELQILRLENPPIDTEELEGLSEGIEAVRSKVLGHLAGIVTELVPERSQSEPDHFGEVFFTLVYYTELAIANGDVRRVETLFRGVLESTLTLQRYIMRTYLPPTYQFNQAQFDPIIDLLELSGLAVIYGQLREDGSEAPVIEAWGRYIRGSEKPASLAASILSILETVDSNFSFGISQRDIARTGWYRRLEKAIVDAGHAVPDYFPFEPHQTWTAPPLIKMLRVSRSLPHVSLVFPRAIFAAQFIGPLSGIAEEELRAYRSLDHYFEEMDRQCPIVPATGTPGFADGQTGGTKDGLK